MSRTLTDDVFIRSIYFFDPDGIMLEFACWTKQLGANEVHHKPATERDRERYLATLTKNANAAAKAKA